MTAADGLPVLQVKRLTKVYSRTTVANDKISLEVNPGEVLGLLGHNGAGKTTLLNQVVGLAKPTAGAIRINGADAVSHPDLARRACSMQPQSHAPLDGVTPREATELLARIRGATKDAARRRTRELFEMLDIGNWADQRGDRLSGGIRRLTTFCMAVVAPAELVMLDEPTNDVDPVRRRLLWQRIRALADEGRAVVLVTHNVAEAERVVDSLVILDRGRVVGRGTPAQLRGEDRDQLRLELVASGAAQATQLASQFGEPHAPLVTGRRVVLVIEAKDATAAITRAQHERRIGRIEEFSITPTSLEDVYIRLAGSANRGDDEPLAA